MTISNDTLYTGEIRIEENGSKSSLDLSLLLDDVSCIEMSLYEFNTLNDELEQGEPVDYYGYRFVRQYRRSGAVYNVSTIRRQRQA